MGFYKRERLLSLFSLAQAVQAPEGKGKGNESESANAEHGNQGVDVGRKVISEAIEGLHGEGGGENSSEPFEYVRQHAGREHDAAEHE